MSAPSVNKRDAARPSGSTAGTPEVKPGNKRAADVVEARAAAPVTPEVKPGNKRAAGVKEARAASPSKNSSSTGTSPGFSRAAAVKEARAAASSKNSASTGTSPGFGRAAAVKEARAAAKAAPAPAAPAPAPAEADINEANTSNLNNNNNSTGAVNNTENVPLPFNKDLCTLLRFGPYDDSNSEYIDLNAVSFISKGKFETKKYDFLKMALGQNEMKDYYKMSDKAKIEVLQNVFGVTGIGKTPYFYDYVKDYKNKKNICKFTGINIVLDAIKNRRSTMDEQLKAEGENVSKKRLTYQLEWFNETQGFLETAQTSQKECAVIPKCGKKPASSWSMPSMPSFGSLLSSGSSDCPCLTDINLLYDLVLLVNHLQGSAPEEVKGRISEIPFQDLLKIAQNKNSKDDMSGHIKVVLGHLLEYLMILKESGAPADNSVLLRLYKLINTSDQSKTSITEKEFEAFIDEINIKLNSLVTKDSELTRLSLQLKDLRTQLDDCLRKKTGTPIETQTEPGAKGEPIGTQTGPGAKGEPIETQTGPGPSGEPIETQTESENTAYGPQGPSTQNYTKLQNKLDEMTGKRDELQKRIDDALALLEQLRIERDATLNELEALRVSNTKEKNELLKNLGDALDKLAKPSDENTELLNIITAIQDKLKEAIEELAAARLRLNKLLTDLYSDLNDAKAELAKLKGKSGDDNKGRIRVLEKMIADTLADVGRAQELQKTLKSDLEAYRANLEAKLAALRKQLEDEKISHAADLKRLSDSQEIVQKLNDELAAAQNELKRLRGRPKINAEVNVSSLKDELAKTKAELDKLRKSSGDNGRRIGVLEQIIASTLIDLKKVQDELDATRVDVDKLRKSGADKDKRILELINLIDELEQQIEELTGSDINPTLQGQLDDYQEAFYKLFNENVDKDELIKIYEEIIRGLEKADEVVRAKLLAKVKELREAGADYDRLIKTLEEEMQKDPVVFTMFIERLIPFVIEKEGQTVIIEDESAKDELNKLAAKIKALKSDTDSEINKLTGERDQCLDKLADLNARKDKAIDDLNKAQDILANLRAEIDRLRKKPVSSEAGTGTDTSTGEAGVGTNVTGLSIKELEAKVKEQETIITNLKLKIVAYETNIRNLERSNVSLEATVQAQKARLTSLEAELNTLKETNRVEIEKLTSNLTLSRKQKDDCNLELDELRSYIEKLKRELAKSKASLDECLNKIKAKDAEIAELRTKVGQDGACKAEIEKLIAEKSALEKEKEQLIAVHANELKIKNSELKLCEEGKSAAEGERNSALALTEEAIQKAAAEAAAHAKELERVKAQYEEALARALAASDGTSAAADAAAAAAAAALAVAEDARAAAASGGADAEARATAAEAAAAAAKASQVAAEKAASDAAAEAARSKQESEQATNEAAKAMKEAEQIKADGERKLAEAAALRESVNQERSEAREALKEAERLRDEANRLMADAQGKEGAASDAAEAAVAAAAAADARAAAAVAAAQSGVAAANAAAAAARQEADEAKAAAASALAAAGDDATKAVAAAVAAAAAARAEADAARAEADASRAEAGAADANAAAAAADKNASNVAKKKAEDAAAAAAAAATEANSKAVKAEADARAAIEDANKRADEGIADAQRAASNAIESAAKDLAAAKAALASSSAANKAAADSRVAAAEAAVATAKAAASTSAAALDALRVQLGDATKRAEDAESKIGGLEARILELTTKLNACEDAHKKTENLLIKLLALVALDDEEEQFRSSNGEFKDFKRLKGYKEENVSSTNQDICIKALTKLIGKELKSASIQRLPEDIFTIYKGYVAPDDEMTLYQEIKNVLSQSKAIINSGKVSTEIDLPVGLLTGLIGSIEKVNKPNVDFLDNLLQKFALSVTGKVPSIVSIPRIQDVMSGDNYRKIPIGILAIKFFQLCKKLGIGLNNNSAVAEAPLPAAEPEPVPAAEPEPVPAEAPAAEPEPAEAPAAAPEPENDLSGTQLKAVQYLVSEEFKSRGKPIPKGLSQKQYALYVKLKGKVVDNYEIGAGLTYGEVLYYAESPDYTSMAREEVARRRAAPQGPSNEEIAKRKAADERIKNLLKSKPKGGKGKTHKIKTNKRKTRKIKN